MNLSIAPINQQPQMVQQSTTDVQIKNQDLSKDLVKANVEAMISLGKMEYIGTLVDMYV